MVIINALAAIASLLTTAFSFLNWISDRKLNEEIQIVVKHGNEEKYLPLQVKRRYFSRSEVQGLLRAARKNQNQYSIPYIGEAAFAQQLEKVQEGKPLFAQIKSLLKKPIKRGQSAKSLELDHEYNTLYILVENQAEFEQFKSR